jgi:long-chain fatty acid transport protein
MRLRGGFFFEPSPAPAQTQTGNLYDNARAALTVGYGVQLGPPFPRIALDLFGQAQGLIPRDNVKAASVPADNPGSPSVSTGGWIGAFGTTVGVQF